MSDAPFPIITNRAATGPRLEPEAWSSLTPVPSVPTPNLSRAAVKRREPVRYPGNLAASLADVRMMLRAVDDAMSAEAVPADARRRVVDRVLWGEPSGL